MKNRMHLAVLAVAILLSTLGARPSFATQHWTQGDVIADAGGIAVHLQFGALFFPLQGGVVYSNSKGQQFTGAVDICYLPGGNKALLVGRTTSSNFFNGVGYFLVEVEDNGTGNPTSPDRIRVLISPGPFPCAFTGILPGIVRSGDLEVRSSIP